MSFRSVGKRKKSRKSREMLKLRPDPSANEAEKESYFGADESESEYFSDEQAEDFSFENESLEELDPK